MNGIKNNTTTPDRYMCDETIKQKHRRGQGKWPQDKSNYQSSRNLRGRGKSTS